MANWKKVALSGEIVNADLTGTAAITSANLASTAVTAASYTNTSLTVNAQGQITAASTGSAGDSNQNAYSHVAVSGQTTADADTTTDTLTLVAAGGMTITTSGDSVTLSSSDNNDQLTTEEVQDIVGAMFTSNTETNTTVTYQDGDGTIDVETTLDGAPLTTEAVQDIVGAMFGGNTETRIAATYEDSDGTIDLEVTDMTANDNTWRGVTAGGNELGASEVLAFTAGTGITISESAGAVTITNSVSDTTLTTENVQDIVGAMFTSNTETRITATYEDGDGTIDLEADDMNQTANVSTSISWTAGTSAGPILVTDGNDVAIPVASGSNSGVVTNGTQTFAGTKTFSAVTVSGDLVVGGTTITTATETLKISDNSLVLNSDLSGTVDVDAGIVVERASSGDNALFYWDEGDDKWMIGTNDDTDVNTTKTYGGDVGQIRIDGAVAAGTTEVPIGHLHYHAGILSVRVAD